MSAWFKITTGGRVTALPQDFKPTLDNLQREVGGYVEHVQMDGRTELWCNEEGKLIPLPLNAIATEVWRMFFGASDTIRGDVLVQFTGTTKRNRAALDMLQRAQSNPASHTPRYPQIRVRLSETDGNAFAVLGLVQRAMRAAGVPEAQRQEFFAEATSCDYAHLLETVQRWVTVSGTSMQDRRN